MKKAALLIFLLGLSAPGCSTMDIEDYDQSCTTADDCTAEFFGDVCQCGCNYEAIAKRDLPKYHADYSDAYGYCVGLYQCGPCIPPGPVSCNAGKCAVAPSAPQ